MQKNASVVVVAAGNSTRMGGGINKQFLLLRNKPVLVYTLQAFDMLSEIREIIVVTRREDIPDVEALVSKYGIQKVKIILSGGETRQESVVCGLKAVREEYVLIHDGARPFVSENEIKAVLDALSNYDAALPGVPVKDTIKRVSNKGEVIATLQRDELIAVQTPQGFRTEIILAAHKKAKEDGIAVTDDASVIEYMGMPVKILTGSYQNIKITTPEDLVFANTILNNRQE